MKIKSIYLFYIIIILVTSFLFYYIYNKYNHNILKKNIIKKINNSYELFHNIKTKELFSNKNHITSITNNNLTNNIEYSYYKSNKHDTYDMLNRDLILYRKKDLYNDFLYNSLDSSSHNQVEHMSSQDNMNDLFPDLDKSSFSMDQNQKPSDLLVKPEFEFENPKMSDSLLNMDTRPDEQKELDSLLDDLNVYIYLLKNSIMNDLNNKRDIGINQKITLYYNLFKDTNYMATDANKLYTSNKEIPNYIVDTNLDKKIELYLISGNNLSNSITNIYTNIVNKKDIEYNKNKLIQLNVPIPISMDSEEEDDVVDPLIILREFADNISSMYDSLNTIIIPYYNFVFELEIAPYPRDDDSQDPNSPDNKAGAALIASFVAEMLSFSSSYNNAMINYIMNENIYSALILNKDYKNNLLKLPHLSSESITNINELYSRKVIDDNQISLFDKTVQDVTIIYNYFMALYYLMKENPDPEQLDVDKIEKILKGTLTFNNKDTFKIFKKYDPTVDNDEYTFGIQNMLTNIQYILLSLVDGFSTEKSIPTGPSKSGISKAKKNLADKMKKAMEDAAKAVKEAAEKAAREAKELAEKTAREAKEVAEKAAKEVTEVAKDIGKGTVEVAKDIGKGTTEVAKDIGKGTTEVAKDIGKGTTEVAKDIGKGTVEVAKDIGKGTTEVAKDIDKGANKAIKSVDKGLKKLGKKLKI